MLPTNFNPLKITVSFREASAAKDEETKPKDIGEIVKRGHPGLEGKEVAVC